MITGKTSERRNSQILMVHFSTQQNKYKIFGKQQQTYMFKGFVFSTELFQQSDSGTF